MEKPPEQTRVPGETPEQTKLSPTIKNILEGNARISLVGEGSFLQRREIGGKEWRGESYQYKLTVPHPTKPDEEWTTYLTVWYPATTYKNEPYARAPEMQIFISTGEGEMPFSDDPKVIHQVLEEIDRQVRSQE